jgi:hypothetical protein
MLTVGRHANRPTDLSGERAVSVRPEFTGPGRLGPALPEAAEDLYRSVTERSC